MANTNASSIILAVAFFLSGWSACHAQCLPRLGEPGPDGYQERGSKEHERRCEGLTKKPISILEGEIISLTRGIPNYRLEQEEVVMVTGPETKSCGTLLCAGQAPTPGADYHVDLELVNKGSKAIPAKDVINKKGIRPRTFGMVANPKQRPDLFVPVSVSSKLNKGRVLHPDTVYITFRPAMMVKDYFIQVDVPAQAAGQHVYTFEGKGAFDPFRPLVMAIPLDKLGVLPHEERELLVYFKTQADGPGKGKEMSRTIRVLFVG